MHWRERISYYVYTSYKGNEAQQVRGKSHPFASYQEARKHATQVKKEMMIVTIERHNEFHDGYHNEWTIDWGHKEGGRHVVWEGD